jgi:hypothetical protein
MEDLVRLYISLACLSYLILKLLQDKKPEIWLYRPKVHVPRSYITFSTTHTEVNYRNRSLIYKIVDTRWLVASLFRRRSILIPLYSRVCDVISVWVTHSCSHPSSCLRSSNTISFFGNKRRLMVGCWARCCVRITLLNGRKEVFVLWKSLIT